MSANAPANLPRLQVSAYTVTTAAAQGRAALLEALRARRSGLQLNDFELALVPTWIGRVPGLESAVLPAHFAPWDCRNNRLVWLGLQQDDFLSAVARARERYGNDRVAVLLGTSTSSIGETEAAYRELEQGEFAPKYRRPRVHTPHATGHFVLHALGLEGYSRTVATACSSSAKVFAQAQRLIHTGAVDAAVVGG